MEINFFFLSLSLPLSLSLSLSVIQNIIKKIFELSPKKISPFSVSFLPDPPTACLVLFSDM